MVKKREREKLEQRRKKAEKKDLGEASEAKSLTL